MSVPPGSGPYEVRVLDRMAGISEHAWDGLLGPDSSPFLEWAWLEALEETGCAVPEKGWTPHHLTVYRDGQLVAAAPAYVKTNSEGEFVFDHSWAAFAERRLGIAWYPKLILAVPFTPATGPRVLVAEGMDPTLAAQVIAEAAVELAKARRLSSAHLLFPTGPEASAFAQRGWARRYGVQFQFHNPGYKNFEDFLGSLRSKRRTQIRRERREVRDAGIVVETRTGAAIDGPTLEAAYQFYLSTVDKFVWGRRYLNQAFFSRIARRWAASRPGRGELEIVVARRGDELLGGAVNIRGGKRLYGRYWGARADIPFLHFEVCFYHSIERCIELGVERFEPGAGGEHKVARGFAPTLTFSAHWIADRRMALAVGEALAHEEREIRRAMDETTDD